MEQPSKTQGGDVSETETQIAVLSPGNDSLMGFIFDKESITQRQLEALPSKDTENTYFGGVRKIVSTADHLILILGRQIWKLKDNGTWTKRGKLGRKIRDDTNVVYRNHHHEVITAIDPVCAFQFDLRTEKETVLPRCPLSVGLCATARKNKVFIMGGLTTTKDAAVFCYEHQSQTSDDAAQRGYWQRIDNMRCGRVDASAVGIGERVYVVGGTYGGQGLDPVEKHDSPEFYDEKTEHWTLVADVHICQSYFGAFSLGNKIYAIGGDYTKSYIKHGPQSVDVYDVDSEERQTRAVESNLPGQVSLCKAPSRLRKGRENTAQLNENLNAVLTEFQEFAKEPAQLSESIGIEGGEIHLFDCSLEFPPDAVKEKQDMTVSVDNNPNNFPPDLEPIAPILGFKPAMEFDKPVLVTIRTWFKAQKGKKIPVILSLRKDGSDWKRFKEITIGDTNELKFEVKHFCQVATGIERDEVDNGEYAMFNDIYIQKETGRIISYFYLDKKSEKDICEMMKRRGCVVFSPKTLCIQGTGEQTVSIEMRLTEPPNRIIDEICPSADFKMKKIKSQQHAIIFVPRPLFANHDGFIEGNYTAKCGGEKADETLLSCKWPISSNQEGL